ncbi:MAG TPA: sigma-70 family RNA polymerase sigma factor [Actinomycetota bacterium]|nr:sigma-70 family RNA polymerase sigma factor [Actinomycetota bacterium]
MNETETERLSDGALVLAIARWRQEALEEAYRRHAPQVFALSRRLLVDRSLAEEVVQEVFIRLWYEAERFDPERGSLRAFLLTQAHGRSIDLLRSETSRRRREETDARGAVTVAEDATVRLELLDLSETVRKALKTLPKPQRVAIELAYFGGKSYREVASVLKVPEGTIKSRIRVGLSQLRSELVQAGGMA